MMRATLTKCRCLDLRSLPQKGYVAPRIGIAGGDVVQALSIGMHDDGHNVAAKVMRHAMVFQKRRVFHPPMPRHPASRTLRSLGFSPHLDPPVDQMNQKPSVDQTHNPATECCGKTASFKQRLIGGTIRHPYHILRMLVSAETPRATSPRPAIAVYCADAKNATEAERGYKRGKT